MAKCPGHDDGSASLSVAEGSDGRILVWCFAGCDAEAIVAALGLTLADLMPERREKELKPPREIVTTYDYRDGCGALLFQVVRYAPKDFCQRRPDGNGGWIWNLDGVKPVPYRLTELLAAEPSSLVFCVEGEKDADRLAGLGLLATTNAGGAGKCWPPEFAEFFRGRAAVVLPDNDEPGERHAESVARSLAGVAASVRVLNLPDIPAKGDVSDWINAGGTVEELERLARESPETTPAAVPPLAKYDEVVPRLVRLSDVKPERVSWLWPGRIPFGKLTVLDGDPGLGKSTMTLDIAARLTTGSQFPDGANCEPASVVLLSAEDGLGDTIRPRLDAAGADLSRVVAVPVVVSPEGAEMLPNIAEYLPQIEETLRIVAARLLIVDPLMAYLGREINSYRDQDVRGVLAPLAALAERTGVAVLLVRHLRKGSRGDGALYAGGGSIGITAAARSVLLVATDPDDKDRRIVAAVKSNLSRTPPSLAYRIEEDKEGRPWIAWEAAPVDITADRLLAAGVEAEEERTARSEARDFLSYLLASGPVLSPEVFRQAKRQGHAEKTLRRAAQDLHVEKHKNGFEDGWSWSLPEDGHGSSKMPISEKRPSSDKVGHLRSDEEVF